jgi:hypothetical protein
MVKSLILKIIIVYKLYDISNFFNFKTVLIVTISHQIQMTVQSSIVAQVVINSHFNAVLVLDLKED